MKMKNFAEKILKYMYKNRKKQLSSKKLGEYFKKDIGEINEVLDYLKEKDFIDFWLRMVDGNNTNIKLISKGIDYIENEEESKENKRKSLLESLKFRKKNGRRI